MSKPLTGSPFPGDVGGVRTSGYETTPVYIACPGRESVRTRGEKVQPGSCSKGYLLDTLVSDLTPFSENLRVGRGVRGHLVLDTTPTSGNRVTQGPYLGRERRTGYRPTHHFASRVRRSGPKGESSYTGTRTVSQREGRGGKREDSWLVLTAMLE